MTEGTEDNDDNSFDDFADRQRNVGDPASPSSCPSSK